MPCLGETSLFLSFGHNRELCYWFCFLCCLGWYETQSHIMDRFVYAHLPYHWVLFCFLFLPLLPCFFFFFFPLQMHRMHDLFIIGSGEAMLQLIPPSQCRRHCQSVAMPLEPGDIGRWGPQGQGQFQDLCSF